MSLTKRLKADDTSITSLTIDNNKLDPLDYLAGNSRITSLILYGAITEKHYALLGKNTVVTELVIGNYINTEEFLNNMQHIISALSNLRELKLINSKYRHENTSCFYYLSKKFGEITTLTKFTYFKNHYECVNPHRYSSYDTDVDRTYRYLRFNKALKSVHIRTYENMCGRKELNYDFKIWMAKNRTVDTLRLGFKDHGNMEWFAEALMNHLAQDTVIKYLTLDIANIHCDSVAHLIAQNTILRTLDINNSSRHTDWSVSPDNQKTLTYAMRQNTSLRSLNIQFNKRGANALTEEMQQLSVRNNWRATLYTLCLVFATLKLPPYVILEICDWLPHMDQVPHVKKIRTIQRLRRIFDALRK